MVQMGEGKGGQGGSESEREMGRYGEGMGGTRALEGEMGSMESGDAGRVLVWDCYWAMA